MSDTHDKRGVAERCSAVIGGADRLQRHVPGHVGYHMFAWRPSGGMAVGWRPWLDGPTLQFLQVRRVQRTLSVAVRAMGGPGACVHGHMADSVAAADAIKGHLRSSGTTRWFREQRSVKPSAQPTLVRTQHLPPPAKTARTLRKRGPAGRFLLVTPCIRVRHYGSMHGSVRVHMVYSVRAKLAVRITARSAVRRPPTTLTTPTACMPEPRGPEVRERRAVIVSTMSACLKAAVARWTRDHAAAGLDGMTTPSGLALWSSSAVEAASTASRVAALSCTFGTPFIYLACTCHGAAWCYAR